MAIISASGLSTAPVKTILDEGWYHMTILTMEPTASREKGTPGLKLDFSVTGGPVQEATGVQPLGKRLFWTLWLPETGEGRAMGLSRLAKLCKVTGIAQDDNLDTDNFVGKQLLVRIKHRKYQGDDQEDVGDFKELPTE